MTSTRWRCGRSRCAALPPHASPDHGLHDLRSVAHDDHLRRWSAGLKRADQTEPLRGSAAGRRFPSDAVPVVRVQAGVARCVQRLRTRNVRQRHQPGYRGPTRYRKTRCRTEIHCPVSAVLLGRPIGRHRAGGRHRTTGHGGSAHAGTSERIWFSDNVAAKRAQEALLLPGSGVADVTRPGTLQAHHQSLTNSFARLAATVSLTCSALGGQLAAGGGDFAPAGVTHGA
jgi:hypothetical protein